MPLWQHKRRPTPPTPRPSPKTTAAELSHALMDAIAQGDLGAARQVFEKAFWEKVDFRADGFHLLQAVRRGEGDMARLLTTHGAHWTGGETRIARLIAGPEAWTKAEGALRRAGIRTQFTENDLKEIDPIAATGWAMRSVDEAERRHAPDASAARRSLERIVSSGVTLMMAQGRKDEAVNLFRSAARTGDGTPGNPYDATGIFTDLAALEPGRGTLAIGFLDALAAKGLFVKPIPLTGSMIWLNPQLVPALDKRGLLKCEDSDTRMNMLHNWSFVQAKIETGAGSFELDPKFVEAQHKSLKDVAAVLFAKGPATEHEAERFVLMHDARLKQAPHALARMEKDLLDMGFFDSPAFTVKDLRHLAETAPAGGVFKTENLTERFNRLASARMLEQYGAETFLSPAKFHEIETAHRLGAYRATAQETVKILDYLASRLKKDEVTAEIVASLKILQAGGADFLKVNPNRYLGKKAPGLCKTLLDLGIVRPEQIDIELIAKRHDSELRPLTPRNAPEYADQAFMAQAILETVAPEKYIPLRGQENTDYLKNFLREYTTHKLLKRKFMTGGTGPR